MGEDTRYQEVSFSIDNSLTLSKNCVTGRIKAISSIAKRPKSLA